MKPFPKILAIIVAEILIGIIVLIAIFLISDYPFPSRSLVRTWEKNYRNDMTNEITDFEGHWLDADIGAYIYSYKHTSSSIASHQTVLISSLKDFQVIDCNEKEMVL